MSILYKLRSWGFWTIDSIKGGRVFSHIQQIKTALEQNESNKSALSRVLQHAINTVPYYSNVPSTLAVNDFPIVNKTLIKSEINAFVSEKHAGDNLLKLTTSGSTGTPFTVFQDKNKKERNTADTMVFAEKAGYLIGEKLYYLKIWSQANRKNYWTKFKQNIVTVDVLDLNDNVLSGLLSGFNKEKYPFGIIGYASALENLCRYCDRNPEKVGREKVKSIVSISESLSSEVKKNLSTHFGIPVVARYSNVENGILGQHRMDGTEEFELNHASYYFEIFDLNEDFLLEDGFTGRIVITDLYNYAMPMIRYDTGDVGKIIKSPTTGKRVLVDLEGRKLDVLYNTQKQLVSSLLVYKNMWKYKEIDQYQLVQLGPLEYALKISSRAGFSRNDEIINEYKSYLGSDASIKIELVDEIPLLASGKRRKVIQEYYK